ncbi:MAG: PAS domain S-box protein [Nanoarchaeota archaeon]|jgi:PAS domain-containing protein|nr:PAS domain S-box protein [Nanoarchaeota archaeon]
MIILPFLHLFGFLTCVFLAVFVFYKDTKSILNWTCSILLLCFALWNFGDIIIQNPDRSITKGTVEIMQNIASIGWLSFASAILCFSLAFSKREKLLKKKWFLFFVFIVPLFFIYKQWTNCITINPIRQSYGWLYSWTDTIWTYLFYVYYSLFTLLSIYFIYSYGRKTKNINEKKQAKIISLSVIASLILGTLFDVVFQELGIYGIPTIADLLIFIFAIGLFYAIIKYRFLIITPAIAAENIISAMEEFLILLNQEGNIITVNKATLVSLQYEQNELEGKSVTILFQEDNFKKNLLEKIKKEEVIKNHDSNFQTKTGK